MSTQGGIPGREILLLCSREVMNAAERLSVRCSLSTPLNTGRTLRHIAQILSRARVSSFEVTLLRGLMRKIQHIADRAGRPTAAELQARYRERAAAQRMHDRGRVEMLESRRTTLNRDPVSARTWNPDADG
jgi:hypothetical protein